MKYVALLRGINVGGKNKVVMGQLVEAMENNGYVDVSTYINSGNIFFSSPKTRPVLVEELEGLLESEFNVSVKVLLRDKANIDAVAAAIPADWKNGPDMKCDVMFLWEKYDRENVLEEVVIKEDIDDVRYVGGAIIWKVDRDNVTKSGMMKLPGTDLYKHMTIRNCNTVRKIRERLTAT